MAAFIQTIALCITCNPLTINGYDNQQSKGLRQNYGIYYRHYCRMCALLVYRDRIYVGVLLRWHTDVKSKYPNNYE